MKKESLLKDMDKVYSFKTTEDNYELKKISSKKSQKLNNLIKLLESLEAQGKIKLITRGFSIRDRKNDFSLQDHNHFFQFDLNKFFIVGQKGAQYLSEQIKETADLYNYNIDDKAELVNEIKRLFDEANNILRKRDKGCISSKFIEYTEKTPLSQLQNNKIFLTAFLHNIGRKWSSKSSSPLLSFAYGPNKKEIAKKFATNALRGGNPINEGFVILGYVPSEGMRFEKLTQDLNCELKKVGVSWYEDIHNEIMLLDGIMPHRILGLFEIKMSGEENFILNPWLEKMFSEDKRFQYKKGIEIIQSNFEQFASDLNYGAFILETDNGRYNSTFRNLNYQNIPEISL